MEEFKIIQFICKDEEKSSGLYNLYTLREKNYNF